MALKPSKHEKTATLLIYVDLSVFGPLCHNIVLYPAMIEKTVYNLMWFYEIFPLSYCIYNIY